MDDITVTTKSLAPTPDQAFSKDETGPLASMFGLTNTSDKDGQYLQSIVDYFKEQGKDLLPAELLWKVRSLETKLGSPSLGERRLDMVHRYVTLQGKINSYEQQRDALLK